jgi:hypothetical protein
MDIAEFLRQLAEQKNAQQNVTSIGNENLNVNAYTSPTLGGNINANQPTDVGLLSATLGKEGTNPIYKDFSLTNQNLRGGILSQGDNVTPYANYTTPLAGGELSGGVNYSKDGLNLNAEYQKQLREWLLRAGLNANPYEKQVGFTLGRSF